MTLKLCPRGGPGPLIHCCVPCVSPGFQHLVPGPAWPPCPPRWVQAAAGTWPALPGMGAVGWGPWSPLLEFAQLPLLSALGHVPILFCEGMTQSLSLVQAQPRHWNTPLWVYPWLVVGRGCSARQGPRAGHCHLCQFGVRQGPRMALESLGMDTAAVPTPSLWGCSHVQQRQSRGRGHLPRAKPVRARVWSHAPDGRSLCSATKGPAGPT